MTTSYPTFYQRLMQGPWVVQNAYAELAQYERFQFTSNRIVQRWDATAAHGAGDWVDWAPCELTQGGVTGVTPQGNSFLFQRVSDTQLTCTLTAPTEQAMTFKTVALGTAGGTAAGMVAGAIAGATTGSVMRGTLTGLATGLVSSIVAFAVARSQQGNNEVSGGSTATLNLQEGSTVGLHGGKGGVVLSDVGLSAAR